jgi:hypothetical protein
MMNKVAIFIFSDPKNGSDEALGRAFNGLAAAYDIKQSGGEVSITFQGAGTRWPALIAQENIHYTAYITWLKTILQVSLADVLTCLKPVKMRKRAVFH